MKKKFITNVALLVIVTMISSCSLTLPINATSNPVGSKVGTARATGYLGGVLFFGGDASISTAAKNGGITKISTVDIKKDYYFFFLIVSYQTIVTGE